MSLQSRCTARSLVSGERCELPAGHMGLHTEAAGVPFLTAEESAELPPESEGMMLSPQLQVALTRALMTALPTAILAAMAVWQTSDDGKAIAAAFITSFVGIMVGRGGAEGKYDESRADQGRVQESDVCPLPPARVPRARRAQR
jgi:hypothetical protein